MKKNGLLMAAVLAVSLFAGCSSDEIVEGVARESQTPISFDNAFVDKSTRTAADPSTTTSGDNALTAFNVYGYQGSNKLFDGDEVSKEDEAWTYAKTQYWIAGASYNFAAVANTNDATVSTALNDGTITTTIQNFASTGLIDLLAAQQVSATGFSSNNKEVAFTFEHLLAKVKFTFENGFAPTDDVTLKVSDVRITNPDATGTVTVSGSTPTITWSDQNESGASALEFGGTGYIAPDNSDEAAKALLLIPSGDGKSYTVTFSVDLIYNYDTANQFISANYSHSVTVSDLALAAGYSYNLKATLTYANVNPDQELEPIVFTLDKVSDWTDAEDKTIEGN